MAIVSVPALTIPEIRLAANVPAFAPVALDATSEKAAFLFQAPKSGNIRKLHFLTGTVTSATDTDLRLESVSLTTGDPSGSLFAVNTNVTIASASITANTWISGQLTADAAVTKGGLLALVVAPSGTPNYQVQFIQQPNTNGFPYGDLFTASWAKQTPTPNFAAEYDDGSFAYVPLAYAFSALNSHAIASNTDPDEIALKFKFAAPVRICGVWVWADWDGDADVVLYDSDASTVLESISWDANVRRANGGVGPYMILFDTAVSLTADTFYFASVKPSTTTALTLYSGDVSAAAIMNSMAGGQNFHYREAVNGTWDAALTTRRPFMGVILDGFDDGTSAGGGGGHIIGGGM